MNKDVVMIKAKKAQSSHPYLWELSPSMRVCEINKEKCSQDVQQLLNTAEHMRIQLSTIVCNFKTLLHISHIHTSHSVSATPTNFWMSLFTVNHFMLQF